MTAAELTAARERLGLSAHELAWELGLHRDVYAAYEDGREKLSKKQTRLIAFLLAAAEREAALEQSGLPTCTWVEQWQREEPPLDAKLESQVAHMERAEAHRRTCDVCQARERFVKERFPEMPELPAPAWARAVGTLTRWVEGRPEWMRPAIYGAAVLAVMTSIRAVLVLLGGAREPRLLVMALGAIVAASLAGAGGGLVYSVIGRPARRLPVIGPYLAGIIAVAGYMGCILALLAVSGEGDGSTGRTGSSLLAFAVVSIFFGLIVGHQLFRRGKAES